MWHAWPFRYEGHSRHTRFFVHIFAVSATGNNTPSDFIAKTFNLFSNLPQFTCDARIQSRQLIKWLLKTL
jgi:hypothetical protein